jgi:hypothetical protein
VAIQSRSYFPVFHPDVPSRDRTRRADVNSRRQ